MKHYPLFLILFLLCACVNQDSPRAELGAAKTKTATHKHRGKPAIGEQIDEYNGVPIFYNGRMRHTAGRHVSTDGYNYGLRWQCVEFVKRYYYDKLGHKMPNPWGHAKQFFNLDLTEGAYNAERDLYQFRNGSKRKPKVDDIVVFGGKYFGHVAIISKVSEKQIEIVQQNVGIDSRIELPLTLRNGRWIIRDAKVLGLLTKNR